MESGKDDKDDFSAKDQYIGLQGDFGVLAIGRDKTLLKRSEGIIDLFNYLSADIKHLFKGQDRLPQTATYVTPNWRGVNLGLTYLANANEKQETKNGYSIAARYGDIWLNDTLIYAAMAYDVNVKGYNIFRATFQTEIANLILGGMYQKQEHVYDDDVAISQPIDTGYMLSFSYPISHIRLKTQFQTMESIGTSWALGLEYALSSPIDS
ncbi:porin [Shewanella surugensis]|uniref:Porin n=1 Tax=Shewanella surugensis TaxID=212020 RepID=A0ABT0LEK8_9GAMM|nr:porin [Shewanella surugensis]MCL1126139.1 porin [Shewanella surugensis]